MEGRGLMEVHYRLYRTAPCSLYAPSPMSAESEDGSARSRIRIPASTRHSCRGLRPVAAPAEGTAAAIAEVPCGWRAAILSISAVVSDYLFRRSRYSTRCAVRYAWRCIRAGGWVDGLL